MNLIRRKSNSITMPMNRLIFVLTLCAWSAFTQGQAFMPSQQQIEQFKRLPPAQQRQMAESFGVDLDALGFGGGMGSQPAFGDSTDSRSELSDAFDNDAGLEDVALDFEFPDAQGSEEDTDALPLFGRELFSSSRRLFRPATDIPIPSDYILGPGDTLVVQLYGKENASHSLVVNREGQIQFPQIGPVTLAGISFSRAQEVIADIVSEQMIGVRSSVTMGALRTIRVFVLGEVEKPGSFTVGSLSTMTNALFESRGITEVGSLRNVQLKRNGEVVTTLDIYDLLLQGDTSKDARLMPGDVIFVPPIGRTAGITGAVKRPATYEISGRASAQELIRLAGGLRNTAHLPVSYLTRLDEQGEKSLINIDLSRPAGMQQALEDGRLRKALGPVWQRLTGRPWPTLPASEDLTALQVGYTATFLQGRRKPRVPLVGSGYVDILNGQAQGSYLLNVQAFYRHFGLQAAQGDEGHTEEPDHIVAMLEFCTLLCHLEHRALTAGQEPGALRRAQRDFIARYLGPLADENLMIRLSELTSTDITRFRDGAPQHAIVEFVPSSDLKQRLRHALAVRAERQPVDDRLEGVRRIDGIAQAIEVVDEGFLRLGHLVAGQHLPCVGIDNLHGATFTTRDEQPVLFVEQDPHRAVPVAGLQHLDLARRQIDSVDRPLGQGGDEGRAISDRNAFRNRAFRHGNDRGGCLIVRSI